MFSSRQAEQRVEARLKRIEQLLEVIAARLDIPAAEVEEALGLHISQEVRQLVDEGKQVQAIRLLREQEGLGLVEAKEAIDRVQRSES